MASAGARIIGALGASRGNSARQGIRGAIRPPETDEVFVLKTVFFYGSAAVLHEMMHYLYFWHLT